MAKSSSRAKTPKLAQSKRVANTKPTTKNTANAGARRKPAAAKVNVGKLISEIRGIEADEERGRKYRALITKVVMKGSIEEGYFHAALRWEDSARTARNSVHGQPGTARVLAICRDEFGDASGASLMRLRDRLSIRLGCEPAEVATMSLEDFLAAWNGDPGKPKTGGEAGGRSDETIVDGPFGIGSFRWGTIEAKGLASKPFKLLRHLWHAKDRTASFHDLAINVWEDQELNFRDDDDHERLSSAKRQVNRFFQKHAIAFHVSEDCENELVSLVQAADQPVSSVEKQQRKKKPARSPHTARP